ncbi:hypothetical protein Asp14428_04180 [Actinoplanes sp. NBRC 14428]|nr:hypothetical protein Asp14428_04180 [Actinoplanes sp. NBRC 14428]
MDLSTYVSRLREELASAAELGGPDTRALAERLSAPLESGMRLALLDALTAAADEITRDLAPGSVEVRLRSGDPAFVVTPPRPSRRHHRRRRLTPPWRHPQPRVTLRRPGSTSGCRSS